MNAPAISVNLSPCDCWKHREPGTHQPSCAAKPVRLPLSIPRSFACTVVRGECSGACTTINDTRGYRREIVHEEDCPARPVNVSCSISGATW